MKIFQLEKENIPIRKGKYTNWKKENIPIRKRKTIQLEFVNWEMAEEEQQYEDKKKCIRPRERASRSKFFFSRLQLIPDLKKHL